MSRLALVISPSLLSAAAVLRALILNGMEHLVVCPGSRSAPVAYAAAALESAGVVRVHVRIDERDAGFTALGIARSTGRSCAVVTTSGTAVGELLPAVMEASHAGVPLVALTADRPPEMRGTGANQTTQQPGLFSHFVRQQLDITPEHQHVFETVRSAIASLRGDNEHAPGPLHINLSLREPLHPGHEEDHRFLSSWAEGIADEVTELRAGRRPTPLAHPWSIMNETFGPLGEVLTPAQQMRGSVPEPHALHSGDLTVPWGETTNGGVKAVVVAGDGAGPSTARFAEMHGLPLLAEPSSNARFGSVAISAYTTLLDTPLGQSIEAVILVGRPTLSRPVAALLKREDVRVIAVRPRPAPWFKSGRRTEEELASFEAAVREIGPLREDWLFAWQTAGEIAHAALRKRSGQEGELTRLDVAHSVWNACSDDSSVLVVGSSNIIREMDQVIPPGGPVPVVANRGLAGIDGTVATAHGVALGTGRTVRAVVGDLTFLHDVGGLLLGQGEEAPPVHIVVVNDAGGGIFHKLEHGAVGQDKRYAATVERYFGTPHNVSIADLCAAYDIEHHLVASPLELAATLAAPVQRRTVTEVVMDRQGLREFDLDLHRQAHEAVLTHLAELSF